METSMEGVLIVRKDGKVVAIGHNDLDKRTAVFYNVEARDMGLEEFQTLLSNLPVIK
jgi:hypothetical protein